MNSSIYLFGNFGNGYTQYPNDYTQAIFNEFMERANGMAQIIVSRRSELIYYGYVRKLHVENMYVGFCVLLNNVMFAHPQNLFSVFENAFGELCKGERMLCIDVNGDALSCLAGELSDEQREIERISTVIRSGVSALESDLQKLPAIDYSISIDECKLFARGESDDEIADATSRYGYVCIVQNRNYTTKAEVHYKKTVKELDKLQRKYEWLKKEYNSLQISYANLYLKSDAKVRGKGGTRRIWKRISIALMFMVVSLIVTCIFSLCELHHIKNWNRVLNREVVGYLSELERYEDLYGDIPN